MLGRALDGTYDAFGKLWDFLCGLNEVFFWVGLALIAFGSFTLNWIPILIGVLFVMGLAGGLVLHGIRAVFIFLFNR